jgi:hypothetical protein
MDSAATDFSHESFPVDFVSIAQPIARNSVLKEGLHSSAERSRARGILSHIEMQDSSSLIREHDQHKQDLKSNLVHRTESALY